MDIAGAVLVYAGLIAVFIAGISVIQPIRTFGIRTRRQGLRWIGLGGATVLLGMLLPAPESRAAAAGTRLDEFAPTYQFHEAHRIRVSAPLATCYAAVRDVGPEEIALFQTLTWLRRFGRPGPRSILNAPQHRPILDTAIQTGFLLLAEDRNREILLGAIMGPAAGWAYSQRSPERFKLLDHPRIAKITMNFRVEALGPAECEVFTETRIYCPSAAGRRAFAAYWRVIYPGSALIRRMWLRAIQRHAETAPASVVRQDRKFMFGLS